MSRLLDRLTGRAAPTIGGQTSWQTMFPRRWSADGETLGTDLRDYAENGYSANGIIFALVGAVLIVTGVALLSPPLAVVAAGAALAAAGLLVDFDRTTEGGDA